MPHLEWSINDSLLSYVRTRAGGHVEVRKPALEAGTRFSFPLSSRAAHETYLAFDGGVTLSGHNGLLYLTFDQLRLEPQGSGHVLSIRDPDDADLRLPFADIRGWREEGHGLEATVTTLTAQGADLFFGPYERGTVIDNPVLLGIQLPNSPRERTENAGQH